MGRSATRGGGRGGRGRGRGHSRGRNGGNSQSRAPKTTANVSSEKYKRSDNLKDPVNFYSMGSSTAHLVELSLITQVVRDHLAKTLRNGSDIATMIDTRRDVSFDNEKPQPVKEGHDASRIGKLPQLKSQFLHKHTKLPDNFLDG